jgi:hypothetical protein
MGSIVENFAGAMHIRKIGKKDKKIKDDLL